MRHSRNQPYDCRRVTIFCRLTSSCTLVLSGTVVLSDLPLGASASHSTEELDPWTAIAPETLVEIDGAFIPQFTAFITSDTATVLILNVHSPEACRIPALQKRKRELGIIELATDAEAVTALEEEDDDDDIDGNSNGSGSGSGRAVTDAIPHRHLYGELTAEGAKVSPTLRSTTSRHFGLGGGDGVRAGARRWSTDGPGAAAGTLSTPVHNPLHPPP